MEILLKIKLSKDTKLIHYESMSHGRYVNATENQELLDRKWVANIRPDRSNNEMLEDQKRYFEINHILAISNKSDFNFTTKPDRIDLRCAYLQYKYKCLHKYTFSR